MILIQLLGSVSEAVLTKHWAQSLAYSQLTISVGRKEGGEDGHRREGDGGGRSGREKSRGQCQGTRVGDSPLLEASW